MVVYTSIKQSMIRLHMPIDGDVISMEGHQRGAQTVRVRVTLVAGGRAGKIASECQVQLMARIKRSANSRAWEETNCCAESQSDASY